MVSLDEVGRINGGAVAQSEGPVLNGGDQWPPDAGEEASQCGSGWGTN